MMVFLGVLGVALLLFGIVQWARSGAELWTLMRLKRSSGSESANRAERAREEAEILRAERTTDRLLRSSFKVIGVLAVFMWLFLGITVLLELLGINWIDRISGRARAFWGSPAYRAPAAMSHTPSNRNNLLKSLGDRMRK